MKYRTLSVIVIEDEKEARENLIDRLNEDESIEVIDSAGSVKQAMIAINTSNPDAIFLDIQLKGGDAFSLINRLLQEQIKIPPIILNTGYNEIEYAQKAFNHYKSHIIELWLKPFYEDWYEKLELIKIKLLSNRQEEIKSKILGTSQSKYLIKTSGEIILVPYEDIAYAESTGQLVKMRKTAIHLYYGKELIINKPLSHVFQDLCAREFLQISRNQLINLKHIARYDINEHSLYLDRISQSFPVGNSYWPSLKEHFESLTH